MVVRLTVAIALAAVVTVLAAGIDSFKTPFFYNPSQPSHPSLTPQEQKIFTSLLPFLPTYSPNIQAQILDSTLCQASRQLAELAAKEGVLQIPYEQLGFFLHRNGITDAFYYPVFVELTQNSYLPQEAYAAIQAAVKSGTNKVGLAISQDNSILALLFVRRLTELGPFPAVVEPGTSHLLWGKVCDTCSAPQLLVSMPNSSIFVSYPKLQAKVFHEDIYFPEIPGEYIIEVVVHTPTGPEVSNLFPVYAGIPYPERPTIKLYPGESKAVTIEQKERFLFKLINQERMRVGLNRLIWDKELAYAAKLHSQIMAKTGRLAHILPGVPPLPLNGKENICVSTSISAAHTNLMRSPSHRRVILDPTLTRCGVGIVQVGNSSDTTLYYVTERFQ